MDLRDILTNEMLLKKFKSQFELVNYAIRLAANMIYTGRDSRAKLDTTNKAMLILAEIATGKDQFDDIPEEVMLALKEPTKEYFKDSQRHEHGSGQNQERRKARRVLVD